MADLVYREVYGSDKTEARFRLLVTYDETGGMRETARRWRNSTIEEVA